MHTAVSKNHVRCGENLPPSIFNDRHLRAVRRSATDTVFNADASFDVNVNF